MKKMARFGSTVLAVLMICTIFLGMWPQKVWAADMTLAVYKYEGDVVARNNNINGSAISYISQDTRVALEFYVWLDMQKAYDEDSTLILQDRSFETTYSTRSPWARDSSSNKMELRFMNPDSKEPNKWYTRVRVNSLRYNSSSVNTYFYLTSLEDFSIQTATKTITLDLTIEIDLTESFFQRPSSSSGSSGGEDDEDFASTITVEHVRAFDKEGNAIKDITKETDPFRLEIIYTDHGLGDSYYGDEVYEDGLYAYLIDAGDFVPQGSVTGTLREIYSRDGYAPRFSASFDNLKYAGTTNNYVEIKFRVQYDIYGYIVPGEGTARYYSIIPDEDDEDDEDDAPPTPYIIISAYDLGAEQIEAGSTFTLSLNFTNTSKDIPLENIRMTINPVTQGTTEESFLSIASKTNTYYYETMDASGGMGQAVDILVKNSATVGSQAVSIDFTYEYVHDKKRAQGDTSTIIYFPITQTDRFEVDPITDYAQWVEVGGEGYATVTFVNSGKSIIYNVSGYILDEDGNQGQTERLEQGTLEAGQSGSLDFSFYPSMPGDYNGKIIIRYENQNGEEKEVEAEFISTVEEPWYPTPGPGMEDPEMMEPEGPSTPTWKYIIFVIGGLTIAAPIALYLAKRVKAKGSEDFDEDF